MSEDDDGELERRLRVLEKKLARSERNRVRLEETRERNERFLRMTIENLRTAQRDLEARNDELERATESLLSANTALQMAQDRLLRSEEAALAASRAKSVFLANMSHEVRTPLNAVLGLGELLERSTLEPGQRELVEAIRSAGEALLSTFNDVLDLAKIEAGRLELVSESVDVCQLLEEVVVLFAARAERAGVDLVIDVDPELPTSLRGDGGRLRQILLNLLSNAVKFADGAAVVVRAGVLPGAEEGWVRLEFGVEDAGPGIHPDEVALIFEPFVQLDPQVARTHGGTGLGLSISRQLAELMGGQLKVDSAPGRGSRFWLEVDLPAPAPHRPALPACLGGLPVWVELPPTRAREALVRILSKLGATVTEAEPAPRPGWTEPAGTDPPGGVPPGTAVVISDRLPGTRNRPGGPRWLLVSSFSERHEPGELRALGVSGEIHRPLRPSRILQVLDERALPLRGLPLPLAGLRVLLAEDNPTNQRVAALLLRSSGCEVDVASDGAEALQRIAGREYDAVLMDCQMPGVDGYEATRRIRRLERQEGRRPLAIIALTASALPEDKDRCLAAGMDDHIAKPLRADALEAMLRRWCPMAPTASLAAPSPER